MTGRWRRRRQDCDENSLTPEGFGCIGRLDKDTTGLLMFTNDGDLGHVITKKGNRYLTGHVPYSLLSRSRPKTAHCGPHGRP